ncbi:MAG TPA: DUF6056 family protein [Alcaligenes sp.]|nr:DUF6056 family protein [Alcaligenes sp.]HRL26441.1 DUF6056 family protein [Alcaligenes sp.]
MTSAAPPSTLTGPPRRIGVAIPVILSVWILVSIWLLNWLTPMTSDDFSYASKGVSWEAIWRHYSSWSGRLVSDTLASWLLNLQAPWIASTLNTLALLGLVTILAALGARLAGQAFKPSVALLIFLLYWLCNPDLGQTTFWTVGAANYLWPNVFNFGFALAYLWRLETSRAPTWSTAALIALALLAGCSNENTGIVTAGLLAWATYRHRRQHALGVWPLVWLACMAAGIAILILAPGNQLRAEAFAHWYEQPTLWRLWDHFSRRFPDAMLRYAGIFLVLLAWRLYAGPPAPRARRAILVLMAAACLANAILALAPNIPKRALNGGMMYLLLAVSLYSHDLFNRTRTNKHWPDCLTRTLSIAILLWLLSSTLMLRAYHGTWQQDHVRRSILADGMQRGLSRIEIPQYHFLRTLRSRDRFDTFFDAQALSNYYNNPATIVEYPVQGHYDLRTQPQRRAP